MLKLFRINFDKAILLGAFEKERCIVFVLNGLRNWNGKATAYNLGTGVVTEYRRMGITSEMLLNLV